MTLIENTYHLLKQAELTSTAEAFSQEYVGKNRNWYAYQVHTGRDFSAAAAIQCLRSIRLQLERSETLSRTQQLALNTAEAFLLERLHHSHHVADVCH